ncbi:metal ABC transporter solute-binding protein, Zn/Mn family [Gordonia zhaorongruii]|uniref:metal ABC transporter solute-binding protein, Zn/Mn family n=1 Tax=Gordonia zhaorongruii TaxID=2597659 RepID=UPI001A9E03EA|nr:zinc ABC transporter substrate-binding protein [Gordonia zhaorongruii]
MSFKGAGMGRIAALLVVVLGVSGCARIDDDPRPRIIASFTVLADIASRVAGDHARVESLTKYGAEIHGYEPTPGDLRKFVHADLLLVNGLGLEAWFERFLADIEAPRAALSDGVRTIPITGTHHPNPHAWMSPQESMTYTDNAARALSGIDPAHAADYRANAAKYRAELRRIGDDLDRRLGRISATRALVSCEGAFSYLTRDASLHERFLWPVNTEKQATPQHMTSVIDFVNGHRIPAVYCESTTNDAQMRQVARATGARLGDTLYVDSLSLPDGPVPTHAALLRHDADAIVNGLAERSHE